MAKEKTLFYCTNCGNEESKWQGKCPSCGEWNSFTEHKVTKTSKGTEVKHKKSISLDDIVIEDSFRYKTDIKEVDQVLGGGLMKGSSVLIGGEPGIGKSTLLLQIADSIKKNHKVLYISGEESANQIKLRAKRLNISGSGINILCDTHFETIIKSIKTEKPNLIIVDSIQTLQSDEAGNIPGSVNQLKYCCSQLIKETKDIEATLFFIAHVTKEGIIAGPKVVEHMVDTVLYFDHSASRIRILRSVKNRFGSIDEVGLFSMEEKGLIELEDPSGVFLTKRESGLPPGISIGATLEGTRVILIEIQVLTVPAKGTTSRIFSDKVDVNRVSRVAAILEKHGGIKFSDRDIYVNIAGGIKVKETGIDLPLALALYSSRTDIPIKDGIISSGELSLAGEIRIIPHIERRVKTAEDMGFNIFLSPEKVEKTSLDVKEVRNIKSAIGLIL
ncbi:DNA repair protein RadA [Thiospirochaeta perfilievii]|uniref:DNA repair protein RadA n=1 Tax=Thiospirochaeta perfilievii TaxID=252967 RepID=A0A5C1QD81_9SPIO|nr:DNA repair protein RadA [Thiospirochaeta perfilievii]QEN04674.1 DNA repair protein RadA [Thiospirochaeta perfilievii]